MTDDALPERSVTVTTVVFDLGGVVVDWDLRHLFRSVFDDDVAMERFLAEVLTPDQNLRCDLGMPLADLVDELAAEHPADRHALEAWRDRWIETIPRVIDGTIDLIDDLAAAEVAVLALSNFSAETFPLCRDAHPVFHRFDDICLSGDLGIAKPDPRIYRTLLDRNGVSPSEAVFIDDSHVNVIGARDVGMTAVHFESPQATRAALAAHGVAV